MVRTRLLAADPAGRSLIDHHGSERRPDAAPASGSGTNEGSGSSGSTRSKSKLDLVAGFFCFLFHLPRRAFEPPQKSLIYYDLWTKAVVMFTSVNLF
jgi:hypothetical protein